MGKQKLRLSGSEKVCSGNLEVVRYLVEHGAEVNPRNFSVLQSAILGKHQDIIDYLKTAGALDYPPGGGK